MKIAIDGPAGSGKSTISKMLADKLNFTHIDTGAMYRAVTYAALNNNINVDNEEEYNFLDNLNLEYKNNKMFLNNKDISKEIRNIKISENVSKVSKIPLVREKMLILQRKVASSGNIIMDGRDIGYNVLPDAELKIFLTASIECRALRRYNEDKSIPLDKIKESIKNRDEMDSKREISPLKPASDAIILDTTSLSINDVLYRIVDLIKERMN